MQGCKKLFQRDKIFLLCLSAVVTLTLLYGLLWGGNVIRQDKEIFQRYQEKHEEGFFDDLGPIWANMAYGMIEQTITGVMKVVFAAVVIAQFIKWSVLEGKRGKEFQNLLPVKTSAYVNYDYVCGILFLWLPAVITGIVVSILAKQYEMEGTLGVNEIFNNIWGEVGREIIVISCIYSLLVFAKKITRYIPGILLFLLICFCAVWLCYANFSVLWDRGAHNAGFSWSYMVLAALALIFVLLSYFCDRKRDIAGNGLFYFKSVHFLVMLMIFLELFIIFATSIILPFGMAAKAVSLMLAAFVTVGVHYLTRGRAAG